MLHSPRGKGPHCRGLSKAIPSNCGLWRVDNGFISTIHVKNILITGPLTVTPVLFMADGTEYDLPVVNLPITGVADVSVNDALGNLPPTAAAHLSQYGSAAVRYSYQNPGHLVAMMEITNITQSLVFSAPFNILGNS